MVTALKTGLARGREDRGDENASCVRSCRHGDVASLDKPPIVSSVSLSNERRGPLPIGRRKGKKERKRGRMERWEGVVSSYVSRPE